MESLSQFFYNIVPGSLFLSTIYILKIRDFSNDISQIPSEAQGQIVILATIILSLFIGYILQASAIIWRELIIYNYVFKRVENDNEVCYPIAIEALKRIGAKYKKNPKDAIFTMHNYLEAKNSGKLPRLFTPTSAFWSNMISVTSFFLIYEIFWGYNTFLASIFLLGLLLSLWSSAEYLRKQYDIVVKTFASIMELDSSTKDPNGNQKTLS